MSDAYEVSGVTITPIGGGYYDLTHSSLSEPERVQGKEKAEARAAAIAKAAEKPEGHIEPQGELGAGDVSPAEEHPEPSTIEELRAALAAAQGEIKAANERADALANAAAPLVTTVTVQEAPEPAVPAHVPREFAGQMDAKQKAALAKIGVGVTTIVLEESDSIPPTGLFIGHNGRSYMIKPGEEVDVPDFLLSVLDDAVMSAPVVDSANQKILGYRNRSKYPYRRVNTKG